MPRQRSSSRLPLFRGGTCHYPSSYRGGITIVPNGGTPAQKHGWPAHHNLRQAKCELVHVGFKVRMLSQLHPEGQRPLLATGCCAAVKEDEPVRVVHLPPGMKRAIKVYELKSEVVQRGSDLVPRNSGVGGYDLKGVSQ